MWHVTCDTWHVTRDTWHVTHDTWHMTPTQPPLTHKHTPHPLIWGDVKKTSPMKGKVFFTGDRHTYTSHHGHRDSMTESAQWADSVKMCVCLVLVMIPLYLHGILHCFQNVQLLSLPSCIRNNKLYDRWCGHDLGAVKHIPIQRLEFPRTLKVEFIDNVKPW